MTVDQAKEALLRRIEDECRGEVGEIVRRSVEQATEEARDKSRTIIIAAIQRYASEQAGEHTTSNVAIPDDALKGRVIGREGRNIRSFEKATGVDVIIDDTPGMVVVSCFDPVRREIARISLEKLVQDGRIHPARIEEVVVNTTKEMEESLIRIGKEAAAEANLPTIHKAVWPMLGRLHYRTSYGQNVLKHSLEVAALTAAMAGGVGAGPDRGPPGRAAARHRQGDGPRGRGRPPADRHGLPPQVRRVRGRAERRVGPPRRRPGQHALHAAGGRGGRDQRQPPRGPPRVAGAVHPSGCTTWRTSPSASRACGKPTPSRPAARSA